MKQLIKIELVGFASAIVMNLLPYVMIVIKIKIKIKKLRLILILKIKMIFIKIIIKK
jgi:hypothetical protein